MNTRLYDKVAVTVAIAMAHKGKDERHNGKVVEKVTRDILEAVRSELPELIDIESKWELEGDVGVHVEFTNNRKRDKRQLDHLSKFAADQGFNAALTVIHDDLYVPLKKPVKKVIIE